MGRKLTFVIALIYTLVLVIISLVSFKNIPVTEFKSSDKVFHFCAYAVLCFLWFKAMSNTFNAKKARALLQASLISLIIGIIIEVLQGALTQSRTSDFKDVLANGLGITLTVLILCVGDKIEVKK